jgi:hypothetical protein
VSKPRRKRKFLRWVVRFVVGVATVVVTVLFAVIGIKALTWPDVAALTDRRPETTAFIEQARADGIEVRWRFVPYDRISDNLKRAVVVAEDISFFSHSGFDTQELKVAAREAIEGKRVRGASTITQQLAKNLWLSPSRSPVRKLDEAVLTWQLERRLDKRRILELYLNVVELRETGRRTRCGPGSGARGLPPPPLELAPRCHQARLPSVRRSDPVPHEAGRLGRQTVVSVTGQSAESSRELREIEPERGVVALVAAVAEDPQV